MVGPFRLPPLVGAMVAGNLATPKTTAPDGGVLKWRICRDMTSSQVNRAIKLTHLVETRLSSLSRTKSIHQAKERLLSAAGYSRVAKCDVDGAYKTIGTAKEDWFTHCIRVFNAESGEWDYYISVVHVFGCRSAGAGYCRVSNALMWILAQCDYCVEGYVDDSLHTENTDLLCAGSQLCFKLVCQGIRAPLQSEKTTAPASVCGWIGFEFDTRARQIRIPTVYLERLQRDIISGLGRRSWSVRSLRSLIGRLARAGMCVWKGSLHVFHLRATVRGLKEGQRWVNVGGGARTELQWWLSIAKEWNGVMSWAREDDSTLAVRGGTDACGAGTGGWFWPEPHISHWFYLPFSGTALANHGMPCLETVGVACLWSGRGGRSGGHTMRLQAGGGRLGGGAVAALATHGGGAPGRASRGAAE